MVGIILILTIIGKNTHFFFLNNFLEYTKDDN